MRAGAFFDLVERGTTRDVLVLRGPTWTWHPALTEARCRELEPDERRFRREYGGSFGDHEAAFLDGSDVRACVDREVDERAPAPGVVYGAALDVGFRRDRTALVIGHREQRRREGMPPLDLVVIDRVRTWAPAPGQRLDFDATMQEVANVLRRYGSPRVQRDSFSGDAVDHALRVRGVGSEELSMSSRAQAERFELLAQKIRTRAIRLPDHALTIRELCDLRLTMHDAGRISVAAPNRRGAHDDVADAIALLVWAARSLPAAGDYHCETHVNFADGRLDVQSQWFTVHKSPTGREVRLPCEPPPGTPAAEAAREERRQLGFITPSDPEWHAAPPRVPRTT
jgi:hypothetical protein